MVINVFIYVFSEEGRDILLSRKYELLKSDNARHIYVFVNKGEQNFACDGVPYALSNTLTF